MRLRGRRAGPPGPRLARRPPRRPPAHPPRDVLLDLTATAPARTADRCAHLVTARHGVGTLVATAGGVATAGPAPPGGWRVDGPAPRSLPAGRALGRSRSPLVDPRDGRVVVVEAPDALTACALAAAVSARPDTPVPPAATVHGGFRERGGSAAKV
ncbi:hypothetical protein [Phytohabitans suffuscus]|uniref:hypothetical protein n=1 Tax=Phytohabitans suffuscus TaxID=624315 RepID=UPI001563E60A|nr:hypothetical protein [Phytohabitans suffuscus]